MKRGRGEGEFGALDMADCLMLLSKVGEYRRPEEPNENSPPAAAGRVFVCKTCNRQFSSFQALGGHRASHKKPRFMESNGGGEVFNPLQSPAKPKTHECSICGLEFPIGQALGGHMRRHRSSEGSVAVVAVPPVAAVRKKPADSRVFGVDLNLTPVENDLKLQLMTPIVDCL